ncbi:MAG: hypothetical protein LCH88_09200 [Proteobacteria bacterium]|nr:hypothetical protein [Pseudomonadota bacterium]
MAISGGGYTLPTNAFAQPQPNQVVPSADAGATLNDIADALDDLVKGTGINDDAVTDAKLRNSAGLSVVGRAAGTTGDPADIVAGSDGQVLVRTGPTLGFGQVATAGIANDAVTVAKIASQALKAVSAVTPAANKVPIFSGPASASLLDLDIDPTLAANSDTRLAPQKAVKSYADTKVGKTGAQTMEGDLIVARTNSGGAVSLDVQNTSTGAAPAARMRLLTGSAGSSVTLQLNDNSGGPFAMEQSGAAVTGKYVDYALHAWRSQAGAEWARLTSGTLKLGTGTGTCWFRADGGTGTAGGGAFLADAGGINYCAFGIKSAIIGGPPDTTMLVYGPGGGAVELRSGTQTQMTLQSGSVSIPNGSLRVGSGATIGAKFDGGAHNVSQTAAVVSARGVANAFEWGHGNAAGYACTFGYQSSSGKPYIVFNGEAGTTVINTIRTRGVIARGFIGDNAGAIDWFRVANANADDQALIVDMTLSASGALGIGVAPAAKLDVNGDFALRQGALSLATGANQNAARPAFSSIRIIGPGGAFSIGGLTGGADGMLAELINTVGHTMTLNNEDAGSTAGNRILTPAGTNLNCKTATLRYDATAARWRVISFSI